jgi:hypothetical protein
MTADAIGDDPALALVPLARLSRCLKPKAGRETLFCIEKMRLRAPELSRRSSTGCAARRMRKRKF